MKETKYICDVCQDHTEYQKGLGVQVIFETEQNEGRSSKPYLQDVELDLCEWCMRNILRGNYIFASGAMGHNKYYFKRKDGK